MEILLNLATLFVLGIIILAFCIAICSDTGKPRHHDNRPGSYYCESSKALKEKRDELIK